jgi:RHS repeat-associated protein
MVLQNKTEYWGNAYSYDAWGNLLQKTITKCGAENLSVTADGHNWIHSTAPDYQYDAAGNMTFDATASLNYTFDQENRLTGAAGYTYTYDGDGNRVRKSNGNLAANGTLYWYMTPGVVAESDLAGTLKSEYIFFDGERVARRDGATGTGGVLYYFSDHLKTASVITDSAGVIKAESDYYPWGGELQFVNNDSNDYKFTGKKRDVETGLDYFGARYYSNGLGRWVSADWSSTPVPVPYADFHDPQSLSLYGYVRNAPTVKVDADGHCEGDDCQNITVQVAVTQQPTGIATFTSAKTDSATVSGDLIYTFKYNDKPLSNTAVHEDVKNSLTVNGQKVDAQTNTHDDKTNKAGQVGDSSSIGVAKDHTANTSGNAASDDLTQNVVTKNTTQTLTFNAPDGTKCKVTEKRTMSNAGQDGKPTSQYKITPKSPEIQKAKSANPPPPPPKTRKSE